MRTTLFRQEALDSQRDKHLGDVLLARPLALSLLTGLGALIALGVVLFGCFADYTRKAHVSGYLAPTKGLIKVYPPQAGTLIDKQVEEGQHVKQGDTLYVLSTERTSLQARETQAAAIEQLRERRASLARDLDQHATLAALARKSLDERLRGLTAELTQVRAELATQDERLASLRKTLKRYEELAKQHYVTEIQLSQQREQVLDQQARLQELTRSRTALERDNAALQAELAAHEPKSASARAAIERDISTLDQELTEYESRRTIVITAPADGLVTTILAERGQSATPTSPLLSILPEDAALEAQLLVPSRAVGFVVPEQSVALHYQAFPFQRFGSFRGVVKAISRTMIAPGETPLPVALEEPAYRVTVALESQTIQAYQKAFPLQAGMLLDADIALDRRRLIEWVFDPILAVAGRV